MPNEPQSCDTRVDRLLRLRTNWLRSNGKPVSAAPWVLAIALTLAPLLAAGTTITHFDLRQEGDSALVRVDGSDGSPRSILIDTGKAGKEGQGATLVLGELAQRGVAKLDLVILTHLDADHAEGVLTLLEAVRPDTSPQPGKGSEPSRGPPLSIRRVLLPADVLPQHDRLRQQIIAAAQSANTEVVSPTPEIIAEIEREYGVTVIVPPRKAKASPNETSLVIVGYDRAADSAFLFTGDIPAGMIRQILPKLPNHVNVLQAPHHGADPGLMDLIARTKPDYIVISANQKNRYNHPRLAILRSIAKIRPPPPPPGPFSGVLRSYREDRFHASEMAHNVSSRVDAAIRELKDPNPLGHPLQAGELDELKAQLLRLSNRKPDIEEYGTPIRAGQLLITGERGHVEFTDGKFAGETDPELEKFRSAIWDELPYLSDYELTQLRSWNDAQAYLSILAADRHYIQLDGSGLSQARILEMGRSRVSPERWRQLVRVCSNEGARERESALSGVRNGLRLSVTPIEAASLVAAAVADYESKAGDANTERVVNEINRQRESAFSDRMYRASAEARARLWEAEPKAERPWLEPALERLGLPKWFAAFSGEFVRVAGEVRLIE
ncbi:MAG: MBL fold metallo-hydrolase [Bryobacteraceae bacterium]